MSNRTNFYINGEWVAPTTSELLDVINPATEQSIGPVSYTHLTLPTIYSV